MIKSNYDVVVVVQVLRINGCRFAAVNGASF
jgi:hypothetical protein